MSSIVRLPQYFPSPNLNHHEYGAGGGGGGAWTPASSANLIWWFKADAGVRKAGGTAAGNGDSVEDWQDQSGNGHHLSTTSDKPVFQTNILNSLPGVYCDNSGHTGNKVLINSDAITVSQPYTVFVVFKGNSNLNDPGSPLVWAGDRDLSGVAKPFIGLNNSFAGGADNMKCFVQATGLGSGTIYTGIQAAINTPYWIYGVFDGSSSKGRTYTGTEQTGTLPADQACVTDMVFGFEPSINNGLVFNGHFFEMFMLNNNSEVASAITYIANRWNLT